MSGIENLHESSNQETSLIIELIKKNIVAQNFEEFAEHLLPGVVEITYSLSAFLYIEDSRLLTPLFFEYGLEDDSNYEIRRLCTEKSSSLSNQTNLPPVSASAYITSEAANGITFYPMHDGRTFIGLLGLIPREDIILNVPNYWGNLIRLFASTVSHLAEHKKEERQLTYLNTYKTISSMLSQELCLHDLLEATLYCCMEVVSAEAASILILDDERSNFKFYQTEGPAKFTIAAETFPADKGIAGSVLEKNSSEVINDVRTDPRFYGTIDTESGFQTRNMIAVPLVAGEEKVGVLEVLNKANDGSFTEEERLLLSSIAEEIAFAIRNAKVFDYVVDTYCKQRQGQGSCKGCQRPLGSWTPCIKYRYCEV